MSTETLPSTSKKTRILELNTSRALSKLLRHKAPERAVSYDKHGGVAQTTLLSLPEFNLPEINWDFIEKIVSNCSKKRFKIYTDSEGTLRICANQGHSFSVEPFATKITLSNIDELEINKNTIVHGSYHKSLASILKDGLSRMSRTHIHFGINVPESEEVISGMRKSCEVMIFIDILLAIKDGYEFILTDNRVILTEGNESGYLPIKYITTIIDRKSGAKIYPRK